MKTRFVYLLLFFGISARSNPIDHTTYNTILQQYIENGMVDYRSLKTDRGLLISYLEQIESVDPEDFKTWSVNEQKPPGSMLIMPSQLRASSGIIRSNTVV